MLFDCGYNPDGFHRIIKNKDEIDYLLTSYEGELTAIDFPPKDLPDKPYYDMIAKYIRPADRFR